MEIVKENDKLKLVKKENNRLIFINNLGKEKSISVEAKDVEFTESEVEDY